MTLYNHVKLKVGEKTTSTQNVKDILQESVTRRIKTTMIGAINSIEKHLGFLFALKEERDLTREEESLKEMFLTLRQEILDNGNNQIRQLDKDFKDYDVTTKLHHIKLPVKG